MSNRRHFLKTSGLLTAGLLMNPSELLKTKRVAGIQLYTLRELIGKDPTSIINKVAMAGYKEVEMFGLSAEQRFFGLSVKDLAALLKQNNLVSPSGHYMPEKFLFENGNDDEVKKLCDVGQMMGHQYIVIPWMAEDRRKTIDQYKKLATRINKAGEICKAANLQLAYHNHDFEFFDINGQKGYDVLLKETDANLLKMEMDIYWVVSAGYDPIEIFKANPGRFPMLHVKDMDKINKKMNTEIGTGSIDFKKIFKTAKLAGVKHFYVEQENNYKPDILSSINLSSMNLRKKIF
ncbi:MAG: sugar phosphate isomerase/epimerase [Gloeobacteraceae cyanobacterium ES-bin-316]|nr:sugar phosphate isomerase/epimerase [Ferruginibacter sp.]